MQASPLPEELAAGPFSTARARELGIAAPRLRRGDLEHPTRGANVLSLPANLADRAAAYSVGMPADRAFSHVTSAVLQSFPLPTFLEEEARTGPLHVIAHTKDGRVLHKGFEYQGAHHAEIGGRSVEANRRHLLEDDGWAVRELFAADVHQRPRRATTMEAVARMLGLDPSTLRVT